MKILNLTRSELTPEQKLEGAVELQDEWQRSKIRELTEFADPPGRHVMLWQAAEIVRLLGAWEHLRDADAALIGGPPYFLPYLAAALRMAKVTPLHAFGPAPEGGRAFFVEDPARFDLTFSRH